MLTLNSVTENNNNEASTLNVIKETLHVEKQLVEKSKVRIIKKVYEEDETAVIALMNEETEVKNFPVNRYVAEMPSVRYEGNTIIIPVVKEVLVTEKKWLLVEEVHVIKHTTTTQHRESVTLKREEVTVEHVSDPDKKINFNTQ